MIVADAIETKKVQFVHVVDELGKPMAGFEHPVPSHWIGTDLLPEGAKKAPKVQDPHEDSSETDAKVAYLEAKVEAAEKRASEAEAKVAELEKQIADAKAASTPSTTRGK